VRDQRDNQKGVDPTRSRPIDDPSRGRMTAGKRSRDARQYPRQLGSSEAARALDARSNSGINEWVTTDST
jgi:hypothetical protein